MATSDGESCSAEDRAVNEWCDKPEDGSALHHLWPIREDAFRAGFRAGQSSVKLKLPSLASYATHERRIEALNTLIEGLAVLCQSHTSSLDEHGKRLEAIEAKLRLREPIG